MRERVSLQDNWAEKWHLTKDDKPVDWILNAFPGPGGLLLEGGLFPAYAETARAVTISVSGLYNSQHMLRSDVEKALRYAFEKQMKEWLDQIAEIDAHEPLEDCPEWRELQRDIERFVRFQVLEEPLLFKPSPSIVDQLKGITQKDRTEGIRKSLHWTADRLGLTLRKSRPGPRKNKSPTS
jgi:hypothetical protein